MNCANPWVIFAQLAGKMDHSSLLNGNLAELLGKELFKFRRDIIVFVERAVWAVSLKNTLTSDRKGRNEARSSLVSHQVVQGYPACLEAYRKKGCFFKLFTDF